MKSKDVIHLKSLLRDTIAKAQEALLELEDIERQMAPDSPAAHKPYSRPVQRNFDPQPMNMDFIKPSRLQRRSRHGSGPRRRRP